MRAAQQCQETAAPVGGTLIARGGYKSDLLGGERPHPPLVIIELTCLRRRGGLLRAQSNRIMETCKTESQIQNHAGCLARKPQATS
jgi:hypothetical protein